MSTGQILFEIDPRPFQQAVHEMEAEVANRKAALAKPKQTTSAIKHRLAMRGHRPTVMLL